MQRPGLLGVLGLLWCGCASGVLAARPTDAVDPPGLQPNHRAGARERDPVAREFHLPEAPGVESASPRTHQEEGTGAILRLLLSACETLAGEFTMPLGGAVMPSPDGDVVGL